MDEATRVASLLKCDYRSFEFHQEIFTETLSGTKTINYLPNETNKVRDPNSTKWINSCL